MKHIFSVVCFIVACFQGLSFARADDATFPIKVPESELVLGSNNNDDSNVSIDTLIDNSLDNFGGSEEGAEEMLAYVLERLAALEEENLALKDKVELVNDLFGSRLTMVETSLAGIEIEGCNCSSGELSDLNRRLSELEASLRGTGTTFPSFTGHGGTYVRPIVPRTEATPETPSTPPTTYLPSSTEYVTEQARSTQQVDGPLNYYQRFDGSLFTTILVTEDRQHLIVPDYQQRSVKMLAMDDFTHLQDMVKLRGVNANPWGVADLRDGGVVVTSEDKPHLFFLAYNQTNLMHEYSVVTEKTYRGVAVCDDGSIVVSSRYNDDFQSYRNASIDVITREGQVVETLLTNRTDLDKPLFLTCRGGDIYISDWTSHKVLVMHKESRHVFSRYGFTNLEDIAFVGPRVVAFDDEDNMYVTTGGEVCLDGSAYYWNDNVWCLVQVSPNGQYRLLKNYDPPQSGLFAYGLAISGDRLFVSWARYSYGDWVTELAAYDLPPPLQETSTTWTQGPQDRTSAPETQTASDQTPATETQPPVDEESSTFYY